MALQNVGDSFCINVVCNKFKDALLEADDVDLKLYLEGFEELNRLLRLLGPIFTVLNKTLGQKTEHLNRFLREKYTFYKYKTVKTMIEHEIEYDLLHTKGYISCTQTLLEVQRGLYFIRLILKKLEELEDHEKTTKACREAYEQTLAKHHPFMMRNVLKCGIYFLPTRGQMLKKVCGSEENIEYTLNMLPEALTTSAAVSSRIEGLYALHRLQNI